MDYHPCHELKGWGERKRNKDCVSSNLASRALPTANLNLSYEARKRAIKHMKAGELQENQET